MKNMHWSIPRSQCHRDSVDDKFDSVESNLRRRIAQEPHDHDAVGCVISEEAVIRVLSERSVVDVQLVVRSQSCTLGLACCKVKLCNLLSTLRLQPSVFPARFSHASRRGVGKQTVQPAFLP